MKLTTFTTAFLFSCGLGSFTHDSYAQNERPASKTCSCVSTETRTNKYIPPLSLRLKHSDFTKGTDWHFKGGLEAYNALYFQSSAGSSYSSMLNIIASHPIVLTHPEALFELNLTPCFNANNYYAFTCHFHLGERQYYDVEGFDHSAKAYYLLMRSIRNYDDDREALKAFWLERYAYNASELHELVNALSKQYQFSFQTDIIEDPLEGYIENLDTVLDRIMDHLEAKSVNLETFVLRTYIYSQNHTNTINKEEAQNIKTFFYHYKKHDFSIDWIQDNFLKPQYSGVVETDYIEVLLNPKVLKSTNTKGNTALLVKTERLRFSSNNELKLRSREICNDTFRLLDTDIRLLLKDISIIKPSKESIRKGTFHINLQTRQTAQEKERALKALMFSGIKIHNAQIEIPYQNTSIQASGTQFYMNNKDVLGHMNFEKNSLDVSASELINHLTVLGLTHIWTKETPTMIEVYFHNILKP